MYNDHELLGVTFNKQVPFPRQNNSHPYSCCSFLANSLHVATNCLTSDVIMITSVCGVWRTLSKYRIAQLFISRILGISTVRAKIFPRNFSTRDTQLTARASMDNTPKLSCRIRKKLSLKDTFEIGISLRTAVSGVPKAGPGQAHARPQFFFLGPSSHVS